MKVQTPEITQNTFPKKQNNENTSKVKTISSTINDVELDLMVCNN
jgi:hypothetical protein